MAESERAVQEQAHTIAVLGGGPAGLGAAWKLRQETGFDVILHEGAALVGGNAASFDVDGIRVDYGSHRLHPVTDPEIMGHIQDLLGDDLLLRPRHGRIRLRKSWIHFPLKPFDLATRLPFASYSDSIGCIMESRTAASVRMTTVCPAAAGKLK